MPGVCGLPARAARPADAQPTYLPIPSWRERATLLERELAARQGARAGMLFLGDSIVEGWYQVVFDLFYAQRGAINLGIGGDTTQGLLWRLARTPLNTLRPRLVVVLIGTNNLWPSKAPEDVAYGIGEVISQIRQRSPDSRILLLGLMPRGPGPEHPLRQLQQKVNTLIARCADGVSVFYADPGALLLDAQGRLPAQIAQDFLHPSWVGYGILSGALEPTIRRLLPPAAN
ncbi:GDSL family lipase [Rhodovastum atsumiense]|uniref:GDSL family lipase n=2 Tax=Rhodovastum atsumiense TaxID=504468 RepID=A0A5M6IM70_9PROT|nr:GDSL family lipase [Rhodovastum atsumiense]